MGSKWIPLNSCTLSRNSKKRMIKIRMQIEKHIAYWTCLELQSSESEPSFAVSIGKYDSNFNHLPLCSKSKRYPHFFRQQVYVFPPPPKERSNFAQKPCLLFISAQINFYRFVNALVFFGMSLNVGNLAGDMYLNFFILSLVEIPGALLIWFFMARYCIVLMIYDTSVFSDSRHHIENREDRPFRFLNYVIAPISWLTLSS